MSAVDRYWYRDAERLKAAVQEHGSLRAAERAHGMGTGVLAKWWARHDLPALEPRVPAGESPTVQLSKTPDQLLDERVLKALRKAKLATVIGLADAVDAAPGRVTASLERLRAQGYRVDVEASEGAVTLQRVAPATTGVYPDMLKLLDGKLVRFGVVSDTHISSHEEALPELHAAYDKFVAEGITTVLHAGDWTCGYGIYPQQISEVKVATATGQAERLRAEYPHRPGIQTIGIGGNHDLEGVFGRAGFDPVAAAFNERDDVTYLGGYSAWLELGAEELGENAPYVHLLHGKGGMSYAYSYKAQKLVDGYPGGRKPAILIPGHWHVKGNIEARSVQVLWPGCFEWQSLFMKRLGLHPAVGFHIVEAVLGADGSLVSFMPRWYRFYEGRVVG